MSQPSLTLFELDGALGAQPSGDPLLAFAGVSSIGPIATPAAFARTKDVMASFGVGPLVEAACFYIQTYKKPALIVRTAQTTPATNGTLVTAGFTGTSVPSVTAGSLANGDYDLAFKVINGGTRGTIGITFQWSDDGGKSWSATTGLGVATTFAFPGLGGIGFDFGVGTFIANDIVTLRTSAPNFNSADIGAALAALRLSTFAWDIVHIRGALDATLFGAVGTAFGSMPEKMWVGHFRMPNVGESESAYLTAFNTAFSALATTYGCLGFAAAKVTSGTNYHQYRQPTATPFAALLGSVSEEVDVSQIDIGLLTGVDIRDLNGNPDEHDESANPGGDDARAVTLRTWDGEQGVYVNNPRLFSAAGSDFEFAQHRRVMNLAKRALRIYMQRRLSKPIIVNAKTGYILESQALAIEAGANAAVRAVLMSKPKCSGGAFDNGRGFLKLSRTDNLLSTKTLTGQAGIIPLAYPKTIILEIGFRNPALQVLQA
jgi:hypothetical protein